MTLYPPLLLEAVTGDSAITYHAQDFRGIIQALAPQEGTVLQGDLAVTQRGAGANMSVDVAAGKCFVNGDSVANQGSYICYSDATFNVGLATASTANPRIDLIIAQVSDKQADGGSTYGWTPKPVTGTPAASPVAPSLPASALLLAQVFVPKNAVSILNTGTNLAGGTGSITDKRVLSGVGDVPKWEMSGTAGSPQSIPTSTETQYVAATTFQAIGVQTSGTAITAQTPGRYVVHMCARLSGSTACDRVVAIRVNTSGSLARRIANSCTTGANIPVGAAGTVYLNAGDTVTPYLYQDSTGALTVDDSFKETAWTGVWVGP